MYIKSLFLTCLSLATESWSLLWKMEYKIIGDIGGVGLRNYSQIKARELGLRGYIRHNNYDSEGIVEGPVEKVREWQKYVRLGCLTDPPIIIYVIDAVMETNISKYSYDDFYVLPSINMDDTEISNENYMDFNFSSVSVSDVRRKNIIDQKARYKTFVRVENLLVTKVKVKIASKNYEDSVLRNFLLLNSTYENIRKLYNQTVSL